MSSSDDDDERSWSIHDLDHAPSPPLDTTFRSSIASTSFALNNRAISGSGGTAGIRFSLTGSPVGADAATTTTTASAAGTTTSAASATTLSPRKSSSRRRAWSLSTGFSGGGNNQNHSALSTHHIAMGNSNSSNMSYSTTGGGTANTGRPRFWSSGSAGTSSSVLPPAPLTHVASMPEPRSTMASWKRSVSIPGRRPQPPQRTVSDRRVAFAAATQQQQQPVSIAANDKMQQQKQRFTSSGGGSTTIASTIGMGGSSMLDIPEIPLGTEQENIADALAQANQMSVSSHSWHQPDALLEGDHEYDKSHRDEDSEEMEQGANLRPRSESIVSQFTDYSENRSEEEEEEEDHNNEDNSTVGGSPAPVIFMGFQLPNWISKRPSWTRIALFVVTRAPCFFCIPLRHHTDRAVLARLNILCAFGAAFQVASAMWLVIIMVAPHLVDRTLDIVQNVTVSNKEATDVQVFTNVWNINGSIFCLGFCALVTLVSSILTVRVISNVNLVGAVRFMWVLMWVVPFEIFFMIGLFDYFNVTEVWVKHWWRDPTLAYFRNRFCRKGTSNSLCAIPIVPNATDFCLKAYNSTACQHIQDEAQDSTTTFLLAYYYTNAAWALLLIALLLLVIETLESIISRPLVQKSRESNVPAWLSLPILACLFNGGLYSFAQSSGLNTDRRSEVSWIGPLYLVTGGVFLIAAILGWFIGRFSILNTRDKRHKLCAIFGFIASAAFTLIGLAGLFSGSIAFSLSFVENPINTETRGEIACLLDQTNGCTRCDFNDSVDKCPEWTEEDVTRILQSQAKASAALAAIFLLYAVAALKFGFNMRKHVTLYQIDYV